MTFGLSFLSHEENVVDWTDHPDLQRRGEQEDLWQVVQHLTSHLDANPQDARAYFLRGNAYLDQRCFDLARDDYTRALALTPDNPIAYNNRDIAYRSLGNPARAIEDYRQALALDQRYRDAYNNLGLALSTWVSSQQPYKPTRRPSPSMPTTGAHIIIVAWPSGRWGAAKMPDVTTPRLRS